MEESVISDIEEGDTIGIVAGADDSMKLDVEVRKDNVEGE